MILVTVMRDSAEYLHRFFDQAEALDCHIVVAEGDSTDSTYEQLAAYGSDGRVTILKVEHGGPKFGSVDNPQRWRQLGAVCEVALTAGARIADREPLVYIESDLLWKPESIGLLAERALTWDAIAPMSMHLGRFYDIWGHVKDGVGFRPYPPFFPGWAGIDQLYPIDSAGSCFALSPRAQQYAHFSPVDCIRGIGRSLSENGIVLWLDPTLTVEHP